MRSRGAGFEQEAGDDGAGTGDLACLLGTTDPTGESPEGLWKISRKMGVVHCCSIY